MRTTHSDDPSRSEKEQGIQFVVGYSLLGLLFLGMLGQLLGGRAFCRGIVSWGGALLGRLRILPTEQIKSLPDPDDGHISAEATHDLEDAPSPIRPPPLSRNSARTTVYAHYDVDMDILTASQAIPDDTEPLIPPAFGRHILPRARPRLMSRSTVFSMRKSLHSTEESTATHTTNGGGYTTDATMSTLPPSYKTCRSHPDLPGYSSTGDHPPLPTAAASNAEHVPIPSSVYIPPGRRRRSRSRGGTYNALSSDSEPLPAVPGYSPPIRSKGIKTQEYPRKSTDGGVRLAGGPLGEV